MGGTAECDLCGLPLLGRPVRANEHVFCCEGCRRVSAVAEAAGIVTGAAATQARPYRDAAQRKAQAAAAAGARTTTYRVDGMWCASCATVLIDALMALPGVYDAEVSYASGLARVTRDPETVSAEEVTGRIELLGYRASTSRTAGPSAESASDTFLRLFVGAAVGMWVMWPTLFAVWPTAVQDGWGAENPFQLFTAGLSLVVLLYSGWPFLRGAWQAARVSRVTMDSLVVLGTWTAWIYSVWGMRHGSATYFDTATMITCIVLLGRLIEQTRGHDGGAAAALASAEARWAWRVPEQGSIANASRVDIADIVVGDLVAIRAGERVPVDGAVQSGTSEVDRSMLTGEPLPATVAEGDEVWAGSLNLTGLLGVRVTRSSTDSLLGRIAAIVEDAAFARSMAQRLADSAAALFVPAVIAAAAITIGTSLLTGVDVANAIERAVSVLVVACPCALALATPLAVANAVAAGTQLGAVLRGGPVLERVERITTVAFDKTGTLTTGRLAFAGFLSERKASGGITGGATGDAQDKELLTLAASIEAGDPHPVAVALTEAAAGQTLAEASGLERVPGGGLSAEIGGRRVLLGNERLLADHGVNVDNAMRAEAEQWRSAGSLVVWIADTDTHATRGLRFHDPVRTDAARAVASLHRRGLRTAIVSGDAAATCNAVATAVGIDEVYAEVAPQQKEAVVEQLSERGPVAFIGDGVNDVAALTAADIAIAVESGSDVAVLSADIVLTGVAGGSPLGPLPAVLDLAALARRVVRQNLAWAFTYNIIAIPLAVTGRLSPIAAAIAMALSSAAVVANSLRVRVPAREQRGPAAPRLRSTDAAAATEAA